MRLLKANDHTVGVSTMSVVVGESKPCRRTVRFQGQFVKIDAPHAVYRLVSWSRRLELYVGYSAEPQPEGLPNKLALTPPLLPNMSGFFCCMPKYELSRESPLAALSDVAAAFWGSEFTWEWIDNVQLQLGKGCLPQDWMTAAALPFKPSEAFAENLNVGETQ